MDEKLTAAKLDFLAGGGKMGEIIRSKDWSATALGAPDKWPQSLRTAVSICIASNFPIAIAWGPQRVQIYNDGYLPITGDMHPKAIGQDFKECWLSAWPVIGQAFEEASLGQTRFLENQRIFLDRYGYKEETFFTFSFSPILDESGAVGGLFHPVIDQTQQTLAERRLNILPAISNQTVNARTTEEASSLILNCLKDFALDIPFVLLYSIAADGKQAHLEGFVGVEKDASLAPAKINLQAPAVRSWPFTEAIKTGKRVQVENLEEIFGPINCGPYPEPPKQALVFPVILNSTSHTNYFLVAGVSSRRSLDEKYLLFYELVTATVTNVLTKARAYEEERKKAEALAEIDRVKTVFFSNISHEFRTPLTLILSPLEELLNKANSSFSPSEKQNIETTHRNAMRLLKLVNTLLDFSRIESGQQQAMFSLVDIAAFTKDLAANFRSIVEKEGLMLIVKAETISKPVYVDRQMWEKIVFNLLSNAFKYTLKGEITVELLEEIDFAVLKIKDTGVGIPENELPKMFERFHRVPNANGRTHEGTGIGLSLIKEIVKMHKGTVSVTSTLDEGSVFTVKIPFGKDHLNASNISTAKLDVDEISANIFMDQVETLLTPDKDVSPVSFLSKDKSTLPTVLIVDDNADMRQHISSILSNNFNVITANNGIDALHKIQETLPALVLSDIMMPVMDGIGLLKEIKSNKATANIPVIFLTARAGEESRIEGMETGADDYLVKPFSTKELLSRISCQIKMQKIRADAENQLQSVFNTTSVAIGVLAGPEHKYILANPVTCTILNRTKEELLGKTAKEVFPEVVHQSMIELYDEVYTIGKPIVMNELPIQLDVFKTGILRQSYFNISCAPLRDSSNIIYAILVTGVDVSEQVEARKKIADSEFRYHNMIYSSLSLIAIFKGESLIIDIANDAVLESWGKGKDIIGKSLLTVMPEIEEQGFIKILQQVYKTGEPFYGYETPVTLIKNGNPQLMHYTFIYQAQRNVDGEIVGVAVIANEVSKQVELNKKLKESDAFNRTVLESSPDCITMLDEEGRLQFMNSNGVRLKEIGDFKSVENTYWWNMWEPNNQQIIKDAIAIANKGEKIQLQLFGPTAKGTPKWWDIIVLPVQHDGAEEGLHRILSVTRDITKQKQSELKQKELLARFETLVIQAPVAICVLRGKDYVIETINEAMVEMWGKQAVDVLNKPAFTVLPELLEQGFKTLLDTVCNTGNRFVTPELPINLQRHGTLENAFVKFVYEPLREADGSISGVMALAHEITDQVVARKKVEESEEQFRSLAHSLPQMVWVTDAKGNAEFASVRWKEYTGMEPVGEKEWKAIVHPDDYANINAVWLNSLTTGDIYSATVRLKNKNGQYKWHAVIGEPVFDKENKIVKWVGAFTNIHEQKEAIETLKESEKQFSTLANNIQNLAWIADSEGYIFWYNERWYDYTGTTLEEMKGWGWQKVHHPAHIERVLDFVEKAWKKNEPYEMTFPLRGANGKYRWFLTRVFPVNDGDGKILRWVGTNTDIEDQKIKEERIDEFISIASHELKTPLTTVKGYLQLLELSLEVNNEEVNLYIKKASQSINRLNVLISELLDVSKIRLGKLDYTISTFNFNDMVDSTIENIQLTSSTHTLIKIGKVTRAVSGDKDRLEQVVINLLNNAIKYSPGAKEVFIIVEQENDVIKVSVKDSGIGMNKGSLNQIFEKYHRIEEHAVHFQGLGIGLYISYEIIQRHNGKLWVESEPGKGSIFYFTLPLS